VLEPKSLTDANVLLGVEYEYILHVEDVNGRIATSSKSVLHAAS
jgi:hypothetical protein